MAFRVSWSPEAIEDTEAIAAYIEKDSPRYARAVIERLMATARSLDEMPLRGRVVPELNDPDYRECFVYSYRMIYRVEEESVLIVGVIHGRRLMEGLSSDD